MTDLATFAGVKPADFPRDRWGRPLVSDPNGGPKPLPYARFSSFGKVLEDDFGLTRWRTRTASIGLSRRMDLVASIAACPASDTKRLDEYVEQALQAGGASDAANLGTALHEFTERHDRGEMSLDDIPDPWRALVAVYAETLDAHGLDVVPGLIECRLVNDELQLAGTADRFLRRRSDGRLVAADLKTGKTAGSLGHYLQLYGYATSMLYDVETGERSPIGDVDTTGGIIIHLPAVQA